MKTDMMNLNKRISELETKSGINTQKLDSVIYHEGDLIKYDGETFENETELREYGLSKGISILPVCIVNAKKRANEEY